MTSAPVSITGQWANEFNSVMDIKPIGPPGWFVGSYASTTGATGTYLILGIIDPAITEISPGGPGVPCAMALSWRPVDGTKADESWHWMSGMGGQFRLTPRGGPEFGVLHSFDTSSSMPILKIIAGNYLGDLNFVPYNGSKLSGAVEAEITNLERHVRRTLPESSQTTATWVSTGKANVSIKLVTDSSSPVLYGAYHTDDGSYLIQGLYDNQAENGGLNLQSISLLTLTPDAVTGKSKAISLSGTIDLPSGTMTTLAMHCRSREYGSRYLQSQVETIQFKRS